MVKSNMAEAFTNTSRGLVKILVRIWQNPQEDLMKSTRGFGQKDVSLGE